MFIIQTGTGKSKLSDTEALERKQEELNAADRGHSCVTPPMLAYRGHSCVTSPCWLIEDIAV